MIWAKIAQNGDLALEGYDYGASTEEYSEFWVTVKAKHKIHLLSALTQVIYFEENPEVIAKIKDKNDLLLILVQAMFGEDDSAVTEFEHFCNLEGIECYSESWS